MDAPTLTTARLTLAAHRLEDFPDTSAMWADPQVTHFIGGRPNTDEEAWFRLLRQAGWWTLLGYGSWAIRETATGRFVGEGGFLNGRRAIDPPFGDTPEAGWTLCPWAHGQGYALEAMTAAHDWGDAHFGKARTVCMIHPDNHASARLAAKLGYGEYARATFKDAPTILYERLP